jgi:uncharacterized protein YjiS (DUF1127 family)
MALRYHKKTSDVSMGIEMFEEAQALSLYDFNGKETTMANLCYVNTPKGNPIESRAFGHRHPIDLLRIVMKRMRVRRDLVHLHSLPDYLLHDVGLQPGDVRREMVRPLWRA